MSRKVLVRDPEETEMHISSDGEAKAFSKQLIRDRKSFIADHRGGGVWRFFVQETNHASRWENE